MPVKLRLQRFGAKKRPFYFIVVADSRAPRDGKSIEKIGTYNPLTVPATIVVDRDKAIAWINKGAQPTDTVKKILSFKGVMFWKHLLRGVKLNLFDLKTAEEKYAKWIIEHEAFIQKKIVSNQAKADKKKEQAKQKNLVTANTSKGETDSSGNN